MTEAETTDELGSPVVSVTGSDSVVESRQSEPSTRELETDVDDGATDAASFHGLDDAIDDPETVEASPEVTALRGSVFRSRVAKQATPSRGGPAGS